VKKSRSFRIFFTIFGLAVLFWINEWLVRCFGVVVKNTGISFGLKFGGVFLNLIVLMILSWWLLRKENEKILLVVWMGGGLNLIDRLRFGFVRDYWSFAFGLYNNLADWLIALGLVVFIINLWMKRSK